MMILPVALERKMTRRALVSLCFLRRSIPTNKEIKKDETEKIKRDKGRTDTHL
jgi:hypothetical protein